MNYFLSSLAILICSALGTLQMEHVYNASFTNWEENPTRYIIENPDGDYFEEALELIDYKTQNVDDNIPTCNKNAINIELYYGGHVLIQNEIYPNEDIIEAIAATFNTYVISRRSTNDKKNSIYATEVQKARLSMLASYGPVLNKCDVSNLRLVCKGIQLFEENLVYTTTGSDLKKEKEEIKEYLAHVLLINDFPKPPPPPPPPPIQ